MHVRFVRLFVSALFVTTFAFAQGDAEEVLRAMPERWAELYHQGEFEAIVDLYTEDAIWADAFGLFEGHDAIYNAIDTFMPVPVEEGTLEIETDEVEVYGDVAHSMGTYVLSAPDGSPMMRGNWGAISKLVDGEWKMHRHFTAMLLPQPEPEGDVREAVYDVLDRWVEFHRQGDFRSIADLYTEDAVVLNFAGRTEGREAIYEAMAAPFPPPLDEATLELMTDEAEVFGDAAYSMGSYAYAAPDGSILVQGTYVALFKLVDGEWKMHRHVINMAMPAPEPEVEAP